MTDIGTNLRMSARRRPLRTARITAELVWFIASARRRRDPFHSYARLQQLERVHRSPIGVWILSGHAEVAAALRDPRLSSDEGHIDTSTLHLGPLRRLLGRGSDTIEHGPFFERVPRLLLFRDPPDHTRLRRLVSRSFTARRVTELEPRIAQIAGELLDQVGTAGQGELMSGFAYPFPARVICELIGVPPDEVHHIIDHAPALAAGLDPGPLLTPAARDAANRATVAIVDYVEQLVERRRAHPDDGLLSALLATSDADGDTLSTDEVVDTILLLLIAGHETTANLLGNGIVALLGQPEALAELRADPTLDAAAVDELLRYDSPVQMAMRVATQPVDFGGDTVDTGGVVVCCTGAANRDPLVFDEPDRLDWHRGENPHLAFGGGIHHCLGAPLARAEARIALRGVLDRWDDLALARPATPRPSFTIRGRHELHLTWTPRRPVGSPPDNHPASR
jgi:cytochrome P450